VAYVITEPCVDTVDTSCVEVCPVDCIYGDPRWRTLFIHPEECIDCALCVDACPVEAIYPADGVPERWRHWIARNYEAFGLAAPDAGRTASA